MSLIGLFLVSMAAVGYETALIRYFAVSKWSEYGYWVISIVMVGFALSGVVLALFREAAGRMGATILTWLPPLLIATAAIGFHLTRINPFNPLQLQNAATWQSQIWLIAGYYAALLPFFFLTGVYVSLSFVLGARRIGLVYGFDLAGAAAGAAGVLMLLYVLHPFDLVPALLAPLALAALCGKSHGKRAAMAAMAVSLLGAEVLLLEGGRAEINDFKAIYAPSHTPDAKAVVEIRSPRGIYVVLDSFAERLDTDISNNAGMMGVDGPPRAFGLYRDGNRIAALPMPGKIEAGYADAALSALPYKLIPDARVLLVGASGGFRIAEARALGASQVRALEPEPVLGDALARGLGPSPRWPIDPVVRLSGMSPLEAARHGVYDVIDVSADFLDAAEANVAGLTVEAILGYTHVLAPNGIVSLPASIRDFPVYGLRLMATLREALVRAGVKDPADHVVVCRSAWSVRVLASLVSWTPERLELLRGFAEERSFDVSWRPGMDVAAAREGIFNDLPSVSLAQGTVSASGADDAIADEAEAVLKGLDTPSRRDFNLSPVTLDRPFYYALPRLDQFGTVLRRLEILPQAEVGVVVNVVVLAQAAVIGAVVLLVPLAAPARVRTAAAKLWRAALFFPALGLGFLFIEICAIEKASIWLNDRVSAFAIVLTVMLLFSGGGSMMADRNRSQPHRAIAFATFVVMAWLAFAIVGLDALILATLGMPPLGKIGLLVLVLAPVSFALGMPFPLGLSRTGDSGFLPWAWGLNGAFSVVATPLANLLAREAGYSRVLFCAALLYALALFAFPTVRTAKPWQNFPSPAGK